MWKIVGDLDQKKSATRESMVETINLPKDLVNIIYGYNQPRINRVIMKMNSGDKNKSVYVSEDLCEFTKLKLLNKQWIVFDVMNSDNKILFVIWFKGSL